MMFNKTRQNCCEFTVDVLESRFKIKTNQKYTSNDFDNDLLTFDVISVIYTTLSEVGLKHGTI